MTTHDYKRLASPLDTRRLYFPRWAHQSLARPLLRTCNNFRGHLSPAFLKSSSFDVSLRRLSTSLTAFLFQPFVSLLRPFLPLWGMVGLSVIHGFECFRSWLLISGYSSCCPTVIGLCGQPQGHQGLAPLKNYASLYPARQGDGDTLHSLCARSSKYTTRLWYNQNRQRKRSILLMCGSISYLDIIDVAKDGQLK